MIVFKSLFKKQVIEAELILQFLNRLLNTIGQKEWFCKTLIMILLV